jgi:nucleolar pre-ribosomal-associated protein 1
MKCSCSESDERIVFAQSWLEGEPDAQCIFDTWAQTNTVSTPLASFLRPVLHVIQRQTILLVLIVSAFSNLVSLLALASSQQHLGQPIIRLLLTPQWTHRLNTYLSGSHSELLLVSLKLWNSMSNYGSGSERKAVLDAFAWEAKVAIITRPPAKLSLICMIQALPKLFFMRRKGKASENLDSLTKPGTSIFSMFSRSGLTKRAKQTFEPSTCSSSFPSSTRILLQSLRRHLLSGIWILSGRSSKVWRRTRTQ